MDKQNARSLHVGPQSILHWLLAGVMILLIGCAQEASNQTGQALPNLSEQDRLGLIEVAEAELVRLAREAGGEDVRAEDVVAGSGAVPSGPDLNFSNRVTISLWQRGRLAGRGTEQSPEGLADAVLAATRLAAQATRYMPENPPRVQIAIAGSDHPMSEPGFEPGLTGLTVMGGAQPITLPAASLLESGRSVEQVRKKYEQTFALNNADTEPTLLWHEEVHFGRGLRMPLATFEKTNALPPASFDARDPQEMYVAVREWWREAPQGDGSLIAGYMPFEASVADATESLGAQLAAGQLLAEMVSRSEYSFRKHEAHLAYLRDSLADATPSDNELAAWLRMLIASPLRGELSDEITGLRDTLFSDSIPADSPQIHLALYEYASVYPGMFSKEQLTASWPSLPYPDMSLPVSEIGLWTRAAWQLYVASDDQQFLESSIALAEAMPTGGGAQELAQGFEARAYGVLAARTLASHDAKARLAAGLMDDLAALRTLQYDAEDVYLCQQRHHCYGALRANSDTTVINVAAQIPFTQGLLLLTRGPRS